MKFLLLHEKNAITSHKTDKFQNETKYHVRLNFYQYF